LSREIKNGTQLWREAHLQVKMYKTPQIGTNLCSSNVEKWHDAVARHTKSKCTKHHARGPVFEVPISKKRSTFARQNAQNTTARRCGANRICLSKCTRHHMFRPLFEVSIPGTPLWREAYLQVKMYKTPHVRTTF